MEKFYIVTEDSCIYKQYFDYLENRKIVNELVNEVFNKNGIEAGEYVIATNCDVFAIVPTENDMSKFANQLKKQSRAGARSAFKKTSPIFKEMFAELNARNLKVLWKPKVSWEFRIYGASSTRLFGYKGILYSSIECKGEFDIPQGFSEIKGSEFWKIMEDMNNGN